MPDESKYDVVVVGAGVFGAWAALHLRRRKLRVLLLDAYGPANARASSAGESRIIRMGYGADELYTRWSQRSLVQWKEFFAATQQSLLHETGVLWLASARDARVQQTAQVLARCGIIFEMVNRAALEQRYPQIDFDGIAHGLYEPRSGVLMARRAVAAIVEEALRIGVEYRFAQIAPLKGSGSQPFITSTAGERFHGERFVFACGPWLGKVFSDVLGSRIFPTRQEVFFFGVPPGDVRFAPPAMPTWLFQEDEMYGMPDLETRGFKIAIDHHGERVDPDTQQRVVSAQASEFAAKYLARRFPAMAGAPIVETRVCQYENTSSGDFVIDRHPRMENVWFAGGGSGHGFKHGPAVGEYLAGQLLDEAAAEPRFSLQTKATVQHRAVF